MIVQAKNQPSGQPGASIILDYGVDGERCDDKEMRICERGMCFKSRWQFDPGAELAIALTHHDPCGNLRRADLKGIIASCEKNSANCFQITLLFVDLPADMKPVIAEIASRLKAEGASTLG